MGITIEAPTGEDALTEFVLFHDQVYEYRDARWTAPVPFHLPLLTGDSPFADGRTLRPLVAREDGKIVARVLAAVDDHYIRHWDEPLGHVAMFEALPQTREAVKLLMDEACGWLRSRGMKAARSGFGLGEFPFVLDDYDSLPPSFVRQNPAYYHALLKDAGFESEKGWVDYKIEVTPELVARYESSLEGARVSGYDIVPLADVAEDRRVAEFTGTWNEAFKAHWGMTPFTDAELGTLFGFLGPLGMYDTSVIAYREGRPVGVVWVMPENTMMAVLRPGREVRQDEKLNFLGIGVREEARGKGVNMAMASYAYLELIRRGATHLSYTLVVDDNWPSRRTGEKLGANVCANYVVYRRNFSR